jgi:hypothetical protein
LSQQRLFVLHASIRADDGVLLGVDRCGKIDKAYDRDSTKDEKRSS